MFSIVFGIAFILISEIHPSFEDFDDDLNIIKKDISREIQKLNESSPVPGLVYTVHNKWYNSIKKIFKSHKLHVSAADAAYTRSILEEFVNVLLEHCYPEWSPKPNTPSGTSQNPQKKPKPTSNDYKIAYERFFAEQCTNQTPIQSLRSHTMKSLKEEMVKIICKSIPAFKAENSDHRKDLIAALGKAYTGSSTLLHRYFQRYVLDSEVALENMLKLSDITSPSVIKTVKNIVHFMGNLYYEAKHNEK